MAKEISQPLKLVNPGRIDSDFGDYTSVAAACLAIPNVSTMRKNKVVGITTGGVTIEYTWHPNDLTDAGLLPKTINEDYSSSVFFNYTNTLISVNAAGAGGKPLINFGPNATLLLKFTNGNADYYRLPSTYQFLNPYSIVGIDLTVAPPASHGIVTLIEKSFGSPALASRKFMPLASHWDGSLKVQFNPIFNQMLDDSLKIDLTRSYTKAETDQRRLDNSFTNGVTFNRGANITTGVGTGGKPTISFPHPSVVYLTFVNGISGYFRLPTTFQFTKDYTAVGVDLTLTPPANDNTIVLVEKDVFSSGAINNSRKFFPIASRWDSALVTFNPIFWQNLDPALRLKINAANFQFDGNGLTLKPASVTKAQLAADALASAALSFNPSDVIHNIAEKSFLKTGGSPSDWQTDGGTIATVARPQAFSCEPDTNFVLKYSFASTSPMRLKTKLIGLSGSAFSNYLKANPGSMMRLQVNIYSPLPNVLNRLGFQIWTSSQGDTFNGFSQTVRPTADAGKQVITLDIPAPTHFSNTWSAYEYLRVWIDTQVGAAADVYIGDAVLGILDHFGVRNELDKASQDIADLQANGGTSGSASLNRKGNKLIALTGDSTFQMQSVLGQTYNNSFTNWVGMLMEMILKERGVYVDPLTVSYTLAGGGAKVDDYPGKAATYSPVVLVNSLLGKTRKLTGVGSYVEFDMVAEYSSFVILKDKGNTNAGVIGVYVDGIKIDEISTVNQYFQALANKTFTGDGVTKDFDLGDINIDVLTATVGSTTYDRFTHITYENEVDYDVTTLLDTFGATMQATVYKKGVNNTGEVRNWIRFKTAPANGAAISIACQKARYIEYADSNITDALEQVGTRVIGGMQVRKTNKDAVYTYRLGGLQSHTIKLKIESGSGLPYLWFGGAYTANYDFLNFGNGGGRVYHWRGLAGSQTEFFPHENINGELMHQADVIVCGYGTNDTRSNNDYSAYRIVTLTTAQVQDLDACTIQSIVANGANWDVKLRNVLITAVDLFKVQSNNLIGNSTIALNDIVIIGDFRWSAYNTQERIVKAFDSATGTITFNRALNLKEIEAVNNRHQTLAGLVGQTMTVRNWNNLEQSYKDALSTVKEGNPNAKLVVTSLGLQNYRQRNSHGFDTVLRRVAAFSGAEFCNLKLALWENDKAELRNWTQTLASTGAQEYVLNAGSIEFPYVTVNGLRYDNCYVQMYKGNKIVTVTALADSGDDTLYGVDTNIMARLVFIGAPPAVSASIVIKGLTNIWSSDYTHPYNSVAANKAYAQAICKHIA